MKLFNKKALAVVTAGLLGASVTGSALASISSTAFITQDSLQFTDANDEILDFTNDFTFLTFTSTADTSVQLDGFNGGVAVTDSATNPPTNPIDLAPACVGDGCNPILPDNSFPTLSGAPSGNYSAADQNEEGAPIAGIPGFTSPAELGNSANIGILDINATGSANSNNNLNSSFTFSTTADLQITISFDATAYLEAFVSGEEQFPGFATAAYTLDYTIDDLSNNARVFEWAPDGLAGGIVGGTENADPFNLNSTVSLNAPLGVDVTSTGGIHTVGTASSGLFSATTLNLQAGVLYQLSARTNTNADGGRRAIPEPAIIALLGFGLLGMGATRRLRKKA